MDQKLQKQIQSYYQSQDGDIRIGQPERLLGGYDTDIFKFTFTDDAGTHLRVLRRYPPDQPYDKPRYEAIAQNLVRDQGFPVPRVFNVCNDKSIVGGAFIVMEFSEGRRLLDAPDDVRAVVGIAIAAEKVTGATGLHVEGLGVGGVPGDDVEGYPSGEGGEDALVVG